MCLASQWPYIQTLDFNIGWFSHGVCMFCREKKNVQIHTKPYALLIAIQIDLTEAIVVFGSDRPHLKCEIPFV